MTGNAGNLIKTFTRNSCFLSIDDDRRKQRWWGAKVMGEICIRNCSFQTEFKSNVAVLQSYLFNEGKGTWAVFFFAY